MGHLHSTGWRLQMLRLPTTANTNTHITHSTFSKFHSQPIALLPINLPLSTYSQSQHLHGIYLQPHISSNNTTEQCLHQ